MGEIFHLRFCETGRRHALRRMPFLEKRSELTPVTVVQNNQRSNQVGAVRASARACAMTGDALRDVGFLAAVRGLRIDDMFIRGARLREQPATARAACRRAAGRGLSPKGGTSDRDQRTRPRESAYFTHGDDYICSALIAFARHGPQKLSDGGLTPAAVEKNLLRIVLHQAHLLAVRLGDPDVLVVKSHGHRLAALHQVQRIFFAHLRSDLLMPDDDLLPRVKAEIIIAHAEKTVFAGVFAVSYTH